MMDTPIYDALVEQFVGASEDAVEGTGEEPSPGLPDAVVAENEDEDPAAEVEQPTTACYWCGIPIWEDSERHDWSAPDPAGGAAVPVTACSAEHLGRLQAAAAGPASVTPGSVERPVSAGVSGATTPLSLPAPDAPALQPPTLHGDTEPLAVPYRPVLELDPEDAEFAEAPTGAFEVDPYPGHEPAGVEPARSDAGQSIG